MRRTLFQTFIVAGSSIALAACSQATDPKNHGEPESKAHNHEAITSNETPNLAEAHSKEVRASDTRSAESHVHGGAVLSIVNENNSIVMELETPLYNLLGFEYAPKTPEETARVSQVEAQLADPKALIRFNPDANCRYDASDWEVSLFEDHEDDEVHSDHVAEHDEEHGDDHSEEHGDDHGADHSDVILKYGLSCNNANKLKDVAVTLFDVFPYFTDLELVYLGPSTQMSVDMSPSRPKADLTR